VSKKLVTNPMRRASGVGVAPVPGVASVVAVAQRKISSRPLAVNAPSSNATSVTA